MTWVKSTGPEDSLDTGWVPLKERARLAQHAAPLQGKEGKDAAWRPGLGRAMIRVGKRGAAKRVLEMEDIHALLRSA